MAVLLMTHPSGARFPAGKQMVAVSPLVRRARSGERNHVVRVASTLSSARKPLLQIRAAAFALLPPTSRFSSSVSPVTVRTQQSEQILHARRWSMTSGTASSEEYLDGREVVRPIRQRIHQPGHLAIYGHGPIRGRRTLQSGSVRNHRHMQTEDSSIHRRPHAATIALRTAASVNTSVRANSKLRHAHDRPRRSRRGIQPDRLARRRERRSVLTRDRAPRRPPAT